MDNGTNLSKEQINGILDKARELSAEGKTPDSTFLKEHLTSSQSEKLKSVLNDPEKLREVMNSPIAKQILSMLRNKDKE